MGVGVGGCYTKCAMNQHHGNITAKTPGIGSREPCRMKVRRSGPWHAVTRSAVAAASAEDNAHFATLSVLACTVMIGRSCG